MRIREKMYELFIEYNSHYAVICDSCFSDTPKEHESKIYGLIDHLIANGVTIEAELVRHGRWVETDNFTWSNQCSVCGCCARLMHNYCPNCGAKMDVTDINVGDKGGEQE